MSSSSNSTQPETVIAIYRVRPDSEPQFVELLRKHHPVLKKLGLATSDEPVVYRGSEGENQPVYFEIFTWVDGKAPGTAHETPEVMAVWEAMGTLVESRGDKPQFEFPHVTRVDVSPGA